MTRREREQLTAFIDAGVGVPVAAAEASALVAHFNVHILVRKRYLEASEQEGYFALTERGMDAVAQWYATSTLSQVPTLLLDSPEGAEGEV